MPACQYCHTRPAALKRPKTSETICKECFLTTFEREVHEVIIGERLFERGERVAIAASGGKDSTVLAHVLTRLNKQHDYGLNLFLLSIDEGIAGYRDDSLESVKRNQRDYAIPLQVVSYKQLYGWSMDEIVAQIGKTNNCTFCGVFRRQALDRGAVLLQADKLVTGHNADDMAETVLMNLLRGDIARLERCTAVVTGRDSQLPRAKPFKYAYEKEIVLYAHFNRLDYFSTECIYSPNAYRGFAREFIKELERGKSRCIVDIIRSGEHFKIDRAAHVNAAVGHKQQQQQPRANSATVRGAANKPAGAEIGKCERCGYISSNRICKACVLLEGLNKGKARLALHEDKFSAGVASSPVDVSAVNGRLGTLRIEADGSLANAATPATPASKADASEATPSSSASSLPEPSAPAAASPPPPLLSDLSTPMQLHRQLHATDW